VLEKEIKEVERERGRGEREEERVKERK